MKSKFPWHIPITNDEVGEIWRTGILTFDTNVLLDLYRYHEDTRNSILESIKNFEGSKWLSHQASKEFFRNKNKVIVSSEKTFKDAKDEVDKLRNSITSAISQLKGNRIIPSNIFSDLESQLIPIIEKADRSISEAKNGYPNFLKDDPILSELLDIFDNSVGHDFEEDKKENILKEAERRKKEKIPPGYLDDDKDADRPYGDYFLWLQVLEKSKSEAKPIILVTSERKEDWWEKISGKTTGPRTELLQEAINYSGQRVLIYQTERFLEYYHKRRSTPVNSNAIAEIKELSETRTAPEVAVNLIEQHIEYADSKISLGTITLELRRPVRNFTVSGKLDPILDSIPSVDAKITDHPESLGSFKINAGTGTKFNFNIHIRSTDPSVDIPPGIYSFDYQAACGDYLEEEQERESI